MARRIPTYRLHKPTGQARVTLDGKDHWLGIYGTKASNHKFDALIADWLTITDVGARDLTVAECCLHFWRYAKKRYSSAGKGRFGSAGNWRPPMRLLKKHFGTTPVSRFGPKALKRVVAEMVAAGWSHGYCVDMLSRTKQIFKYCASEELISHTVYDRLRTVDAKSIEGAPARPRVKQIDDVLVEATVPYCDGIVGSMIQFQRLTAVRPSEVCIMRPCDIDRSAEIWIYTPSHHKTEHLGKSRIVAIGPRSQVVLMALGPRVPAMNYFVNRRGKAFNTDTYRRAIHRACDKADIERWSPNRLRHTAATEIRAVFGLEATQATLGHEHMDTSQIYAEVNLKKMIEVAKTLG